MTRKSLDQKSVLVATRVTPRIRDLAIQVAQNQGLNVSEWLRNLIIGELKKHGALTTVLSIPGLEEK